MEQISQARSLREARWSKHRTEQQKVHYLTELSTVQDELTCPECDGDVDLKFLVSEYTDDGDRELIAWHGTHGCGARIRIFND